jgi:hypothetical protein
LSDFGPQISDAPKQLTKTDFASELRQKRAARFEEKRQLAIQKAT